MRPHLAFGFVDGGHVRSTAEALDLPLPHPGNLVRRIVLSPYVQDWATGSTTMDGTVPGRVTYYDARPDDDSQINDEMRSYWEAIELEKDCQLGFGALRGKPRRQKRVDTLIAVDMLVGAYGGIFDVAVLIAGDSDFVPVVEEVKRRGVMIVVAANPKNIADDLRRAADRFVALGQNIGGSQDFFPRLTVGGKTWTAKQVASV